MTVDWISQPVREGYDAIATAYARDLNDELDHKPFDRTMLAWFAQRVQARVSGLVCDMGCGPGHIARYLKGCGLDVCGIDLSPRMIAEAARLNPDIKFNTGNMLSLDQVADGVFTGIAALYSIVNIPPQHHARVFAEWHRVLVPRGTVLLSFHRGTGVIHLDALFGEKTSLDFFLFEPEPVKAALQNAGFTVTEAITREPYAHGEAATTRTYIFAERAGERN